MIGPVAAALLASAPAAATEAPPLARARAELRASHEALAPHSDDFSLDKDKRAPALLDRHWAAIRRWTEKWLDANGPADRRRLDAAAKAADKALELSSVRLAPNIFAVSASEGEIGTVFVVRRPPHGWSVAWAASAPGNAALKAYPLLAAWLPASGPWLASDACRARALACHPLSGSVGILPRQRDGKPRFFVAATYAQPAGATVAGQLSIWRWEGGKAVPLLVDAYQLMIDQPLWTRVQGEVLHVGVKGDFDTLFSCGGCNGRQMDWRIAVSPDDVRDLGRRDLYPELILADQVIGRLSDHRPLPPAAAGAALGPLRRQVAEAGTDGFGMLMGWTLDRHGGSETLCLGIDPYLDIFTFRRGAKGLRLIAVREGPQAGCGPKANS